MRLDPVLKFVRHQVGDGFAVAADDDGRAVLFHPRQQAGKISFRFMDVDSFHGKNVSPVSPMCQQWRAMKRNQTRCLISRLLGFNFLFVKLLLI